MKKDEAKQALHQLFGKWKNDTSQPTGPDDHPSYIIFKNWLSEKGYSHYLHFRSTAGSDFDAEMWFDQYFNQTWRR
jgi:hypothetical protein